MNDLKIEKKTNKKRKAKSACVTENDIFASRLREIMKERRLNQSQLASLISKMGKSLRRQTISLYMDGQSRPDTERLSLLCSALNVSADYLLGRTKNPTTDPDKRAALEYTGLSEEAVDNIRAIVEAESWEDKIPPIELFFSSKEACGMLFNALNEAAFEAYDLANRIEEMPYSEDVWHNRSDHLELAKFHVMRAAEDAVNILFDSGKIVEEAEGRYYKRIKESLSHAEIDTDYLNNLDFDDEGVNANGEHQED